MHLYVAVLWAMERQLQAFDSTWMMWWVLSFDLLLSLTKINEILIFIQVCGWTSSWLAHLLRCSYMHHRYWRSISRTISWESKPRRGFSKFQVWSSITANQCWLALDLVLNPYQRGFFFQVEPFPSAGFSDTMRFWSVLVVMDSQLSVVWTLITEAACPLHLF